MKRRSSKTRKSIVFKPKGAPRRPQDDTKMGPRWLQGSSPKMAQDGPKTAQDRPRSVPNPGRWVKIAEDGRKDGRRWQKIGQENKRWQEDPR